MANSLILFGAGARNRTGTGSPPVDFESTASTSFTTPAWVCLYKENPSDCQSNYANRKQSAHAVLGSGKQFIDSRAGHGSFPKNFDRPGTHIQNGGARSAGKGAGIQNHVYPAANFRG
jgi:hypothetical protein